MQDNNRKEAPSDIATNAPKIRKPVASEDCRLFNSSKYWGILVPINEETSDRIGTIYLDEDYQTFGKNETRSG
ncbi:4650_t:CDS:2 [Funneliformis geosporum]|uniref:4650_t:CDS:1 n=1 Tax=Funneliformis geosporum TaxID=1117311 RepID=A0A9W4SQ05_9GLOM|nr:4650_t:CDS:2 [Funneliformis geosporum]